MCQKRFLYIVFVFTTVMSSSLFAQDKKIGLGLSIVDSNPGITGRFYFMSEHSVGLTLGSVKGGTFFNAAYYYDFYDTTSHPRFKFYGGGGIISTTITVRAPFFGNVKATATGLWLPVGILFLPIPELELFAELDLVLYLGEYSGSDVTYTLGGRFRL